MSQPADTIWLNCYVLGDTIDELTPVPISPNDRISDLRIAIINQYSQLRNGQLERLAMFKVDFSMYDIPKNPARITGFPSTQPSACRVMYFALVIKPRAPERDDTLSDLPDHLRQLDIGQRNTAKRFREGQSASLAAVHSQFEILQRADDTAILNGRPQERTGIPVQLFHPVFDTFTKTLESTDILAPAKYAAVEELLRTSQNIYPAEPGRQDALDPRMVVALSSAIVKDPVPKCDADGVVTFIDIATGSKAYCAIIEVKNEVGTGECDPTIQGAESYAIYWSQEKMTPLREVCCCPSPIIAIAGPWMCVLGAVYLRNPVVQPLTDYIWLGHHPQQDRRLTHLTRVFHAAAVSIAELQEYYKLLLSQPLPSNDLTRFLPYVRHYKNPSENVVNFDCLGPVDESFVLRPIFKARTTTGQDLVVKFAERYNIKAHRMLASKGLAPKVLHYNADFSRGGLHMIVMEQVSCITLEWYITDHGPEIPRGLATLWDNIREALSILHGANLVFGDLRPPNILVVGPTDGEARGMLVDFDWCDEKNVGRYPAGINEEIAWVDGVVKGGLMRTQHDMEMFKKIFGDSLSAS